MLRRWCNRWCSRLRTTLRSDGATVEFERRDRLGRFHVVDVETTTASPPADVAAAVNALDDALRALSARGHRLAGVRCDVAVADIWMVYEVIDGELHDHPRRVADELCTAVLADTAGVTGDQLVARWQPQAPGQNFACAVPLNAIQALQGILHRHEVPLGSVCGETVLAYNDAHCALAGGNGLLAVARAGGTQLTLLADHAIKALRFEAGVSEPALLLERGRALMRSAGADADEQTLYVGDFGRREPAPAPWLCAGAVERPRGLRSIRARLDLDLSPTRSAVRPLSWALLAVGVVAVIAGAMQFQTASGQHLREARSLQSLEGALGELADHRVARLTPDEARRSRASASALAELQVPWARLLAALDAARGPEIALLSIEPSAQRRELRLAAEAKNSDAMFAFLEALSEQKLTEVILVSHQVQTQTPGTPIRFQARAAWDAR